MGQQTLECGLCVGGNFCGTFEPAVKVTINFGCLSPYHYNYDNCIVIVFLSKFFVMQPKILLIIIVIGHSHSINIYKHG